MGHPDDGADHRAPVTQRQRAYRAACGTRAEGGVAAAYREGHALPARKVVTLARRLLEEWTEVLLQPDEARWAASRPQSVRLSILSRVP